jgi:hypothetical protein
MRGTRMKIPFFLNPRVDHEYDKNGLPALGDFSEVQIEF